MTPSGDDARKGQAAKAAERASEREEMAFFTKRRLVQTLVAVVLLSVAIYVLFPKVVGIEDAIGEVKDGNPVWITIALGFNMGAFVAYVALFRGVIGETARRLHWQESYQITMAGLAATRLFSAGGAGGIALTYWALRQAGMKRRESARRMLAFLVLLYAVYMLSLVVFGVLLRTGVLSGESPVGMTIIPAAIAGSLLLLCLLIALIPEDFERRLAKFAEGYRRARWLRRVGTGPATLASGIRTALEFVRRPSKGGLAVIGALGFWAANIGILWASFHAFDVKVPLGVVVQGFFIGMTANLFPFAPGGVGAVDAGLIGAFVLFGFPSETVFAAVLLYRLIAFWLPIPPGIVAFFQLRRTVERWEREREEKRVERQRRRKSGPGGEPSLQKVK